MASSTDDRRADSSDPRGTSNGTRASVSVRFARTMRCAIVGSDTRKARAISSLVSPPSRRSVSATRASVERTGWQAMSMSRSRSSPTFSSMAVSTSGPVAARPEVVSSPSSSCLRSRICRRRSSSIARFFAVAMSHAPGFSGMPIMGHRSIAVTSASCARSSASPTSRTTRARPPISRADSIRQTASMALRVALTTCSAARPRRAVALRARATPAKAPCRSRRVRRRGEGSPRRRRRTARA